jgi:5-methylcytosine-specific restriction endonuclease McrA
VLRRDGWKCQSCGSMCNLEVHHQKFRRRSGVVEVRKAVELVRITRTRSLHRCDQLLPQPPIEPDAFYLS